MIYFFIALLASGVGSLVALGGVLISTPLLQVLPVPGGPLSFTDIARDNIVIVSIAALVSTLVHWGARRVDLGIVWRVTPALTAGSAVGAAVGPSLSEEITHVGFGILSLVALLLAIPPLTRRGRARSFVRAAELRVGAQLVLFALAAATGVLTGTIGAGGAFIIAPLLIRVFRVDPRAVIGSMGLVGGVSIAANLVVRGGEIMTMEPTISIPLVLGSAIGAYVGAKLVGRLKTGVLRTAMLVVLGSNAIGAVVVVVTG